MKKILSIIALLLIADTCYISAQRAFLIRKTNKSRIGFSTSNLDSVTIADVDTLKESMFHSDTVYVYTDVEIGKIPAKLTAYDYAGTKIGLANEFGIGKTHSSLPLAKSSAVYNGCVFFIQEKLSAISLYDLRSKKLVSTCSLTSHTETDASGQAIYSCSHAAFGKLKYDDADVFPLLYVSQRANTDGQFIVSVLRIIPQLDSKGLAVISFTVQPVQTILLPATTSSNGLYECRLTVDPLTGDFIVCSYNTSDAAQVRVSRFAPADLSKTEVTLGNPSKFFIVKDLTGAFLQNKEINGMFINSSKLYLTLSAAGEPRLYVIDIDNQKTLSEVPLAASGIDMEPYACMKYKGQIIFPSADGCLYTLYFQ